jgi:hypothetical protein
MEIVKDKQALSDSDDLFTQIDQKIKIRERSFLRFLASERATYLRSCLYEHPDRQTEIQGIARCSSEG